MFFREPIASVVDRHRDKSDQSRGRVEAESVPSQCRVGDRSVNQHTPLGWPTMQKYAVSSKLGDGTFGAVFKATDKSSGEVVRVVLSAE